MARRDDLVSMTHPELQGYDPIKVARSAVPVHMASGWVPEDKTVAKEEEPNVPKDTEPAATTEVIDGKSTTTKRSTAKES